MKTQTSSRNFTSANETEAAWAWVKEAKAAYAKADAAATWSAYLEACAGEAGPQKTTEKSIEPPEGEF